MNKLFNPKVGQQTNPLSPLWGERSNDPAELTEQGEGGNKNMEIKHPFVITLMIFLLCVLVATQAAAQEKISDLDAAKEGIRLKPNDATAHYYLGNAYADLGQDEEAVEAYKKAVSLKPDFADAYSKLGAIYEKLNRYSEASDLG